MCSRVKYYMVIMLTIFTILALMGWERKYFPVIISFNAPVHRAAKSDRTLLISDGFQRHPQTGTKDSASPLATPDMVRSRRVLHPQPISLQLCLTLSSLPTYNSSIFF